MFDKLFVDDIRGSFKYVSFVRSTKPFARFKISGRVYTHEDIPFKVEPIFDLEGDLKYIDIPLLAKERVLYVGQPIGMVIGNDPYEAEDKKEEVEVEYEDLQGDIYSFAKNNVILEGKGGEEFEKEANEIKLNLNFSRQSPAPLEGRAVAVRHEGSKLVIYMSTQAPTVMRRIISKMLDFDNIEVMVPSVGGGFGAKQDITSEELSVIALSYVTGLDLKWVELKSEHIMTSQGRGQKHNVSVYFKENGRVIGFEDEIEYDMGAFPLVWTGISPLYVTLMNLHSIYDIKVSYKYKVLVSNKPPQGAFRGFGRPEAFFVVERIMDEVARSVKVSPIEVRRINIRKDVDVGNVDLVLEKLEEKYSELKKKFRKGIGVSLYAHFGSPTSKVLINDEKSQVGGYECVSLRLNPNGYVEVKTTVIDMGQGISKVLKKIVEKEIGLPAIVKLGSSDVNGFGSWASRSTVTSANATLLASKELKEKIEKAGGVKRVLDKLNNSPWELGEKEFYSIKCYEPEDMVGAISGQISVVNFDEGKIRALYHYVIVDIGVAGDEEIVKGQLIGGVVQALGGVLYENVDDPYNYLIPTAVEAPKIEVELLHTPSRTPGGFRPVGENSISGAYASILNAISDYYKVNKIPVNFSDLEG